MFTTRFVVPPVWPKNKPRPRTLREILKQLWYRKTFGYAAAAVTAVAPFVN